MSFEAVHKEYGSRGHAKGCPVCGERNAGAVNVQLQRLGPNGAFGKGAGRVGSRGISLCETHATEVFLRLVKDLESVRR